jgi:hypothetical protein
MDARISPRSLGHNIEFHFRSGHGCPSFSVPNNRPHLHGTFSEVNQKSRSTVQGILFGVARNALFSEIGTWRTAKLLIEETNTN